MVITPFQMGPGTGTATAETKTPGAEVAVPGQLAPELHSVDQLDGDEAQRIRLQRAARVLAAPRKLAGLSPNEQLAACENLIRKADEQREGTIRDAKNRAAARFFDTAGPYLAWIRDNELFCLGEHERRTFEQYIDQVWGYSVSSAYFFMDAALVRASLGLAGTDEYVVSGVTLTTKHVRGLISGVRKAPEIAQQVWEETRASNDGTVPEQGLRNSYARLLTPAEDATASKSNESFDSSDRSEESNTPTDQDRWVVNETLRSIKGDLERLQEKYGQIIDAGLAPLDPAAADRDARQVRALGRWFNQHGVVPAEIIVDAEIAD